MSLDAAAPEGFVSRRGTRSLLVAEPGRIEALVAAGLDDPLRWERLLREGAAASGRGRSAVLRAAGGALRLKRMRRGGWGAALWRDRFPGTRRLYDNLRVAREARRRGVATPAVVALLAVEGPPGLHRAWLAVEEIEGALDVAARAAAGRAPDREQWEVLTAAVRRMHDLGVEHRDLNVGNLLLRGGRAFVIDLDAARLHDGALGFAARQRALRRIERSWVKQRRATGADPVPDWIYETYAAADRELGRRLHRGRRGGRLRLQLHQLGRRR